MSLINEALKRTRDSAYQSVTVTPPTAPEYRVQSGAESSGSKGKLLVTVVIGALAITGIILLVSQHTARLQDARPAVAEATPPAPAPHLVPAPAAPEAEVTAPLSAAPQQTVAPPLSEPKVSEDQIVAKVMERIKAGPPAAAEPKLVLQGITYAKDDSEAMINGVTVRVGEDVEGARVVAIESRRVRLDVSGHEIVLRLP